MRDRIARARAAAALPDDSDSDEDYAGVDETFWGDVSGLASLEEELKFLDEDVVEEPARAPAPYTISQPSATAEAEYVPAVRPSIHIPDHTGASPSSAAHASAAVAIDAPDTSPAAKPSPQAIAEWEEAERKRLAKREEKRRKANIIHNYRGHI